MTAATIEKTSGRLASKKKREQAANILSIAVLILLGLIVMFPIYWIFRSSLMSNGELVEKVKSDKNIAGKFQRDPIATVEELLGIDLPNDQIEKLVDGIKAKVTLDQVGDVLGALGGLFGKK